MSLNNISEELLERMVEQLVQKKFEAHEEKVKRQSKEEANGVLLVQCIDVEQGLYPLEIIPICRASKYKDSQETGKFILEYFFSREQAEEQFELLREVHFQRLYKKYVEK